MIETLSMGGYAWYVWPSYGLVVFGLMMEWFLVHRHGKKVRRQLQRWFQKSS